MINETILRQVGILIFGAATVTGAGIGHASDMGNMMNPSGWMGGNRDYGNCYGGPASGPGYGDGVPAYRYGGYGAPGVWRQRSSLRLRGTGLWFRNATGSRLPLLRSHGAGARYAASPGGGSLEAEIAQLKQRIKELEAAQSPERMQPYIAPSYPAVGRGFYYRPTR